MKPSFMLTLVLVLVIKLFGASEALAQKKEIYDPLKKPHLWKQLTDTPENNALWSEYMNKKWKDMTEEDKRYINKWKKAIALSSKQNINYDDYVTRFKSMAELLGWEKTILDESAEIATLKSNVAANFLLIEDNFQTIFEELGYDYVKYDDVHKNGKYLKIKWVEDHENKINYIKEQVFAMYKKKYGVKN